MAVQSETSKEQSAPELVSKARELVKQLRLLAAAREHLQRKVDEQQAEIADLKEYLRRLEDSRTRAREYLQNLANQLPQK